MANRRATQPTVGPIERETLLRHLHKTNPRVAVAVELMAQLGLRLNEARQARWSWLVDLETPAATISIPPEVAKTKEGRTLPIPTTTRLKLLELRAKQHLDWTNEIPSSWPLVLNRWGKPPSKVYISRVLRHASEAALHRRIRSHTLRHSFATTLLKHTNLRVVQMILGHRSISSTEIYTHPNLDDLRNALDKVDAELFRGTAL